MDAILIFSNCSMMTGCHQLDSLLARSYLQESLKKKTLYAITRSNWFSAGLPRVFKRSGYERVFKFDTNLVARRWTFSIWIASFLYIGAQIVVAYSRCGRTRDLNRFRNISLSINVNVLNMSPTIWFAFFTLLLICSVKFNLLSKVTPRSFSLCCYNVCFLKIKYWY